MLLRVLESLFPVRQGERRLAFALFLHSLFAVGTFIAGRTVRDALFLAKGDRNSLAWMYVASAIAVALAGLAYGPLAARIRRDRIAVGSAVLFAAVFVAAWVLERTGASHLYSALYVYVEVMGALSIVQFWTLANELFNAREAKRLYGLIGAGGTMANILVGFAAGRLALAFGASSLMLLCTALLLCAAAASFVAGRVGRQRMFAKAAAGRPQRRQGGASRVLSSSHLRLVALLVAATFFTTTLVDYQFKVIAGSSFAKDQLAAYFGYFSAVVGVLALALQLFGTGRILNRAGVIGSLAILPVSLATGSVALAIFPALWAVSAAKGADTLFRYSVNDATTQILYLPVPPQARAAAKAFVDGFVKPAAIGLCGLALAGYKTWFGGDPYRLAYLALVLSVGWVTIVVSLRAHYIRSLQDNLRSRRLDLESARHRVQDGSTSSVMTRALESADPREVLNALELLPHLENIQLDHRVESLLEHASVEIRIAALQYYAQRQTMRFANSVFRCFEDPDARVRAAAIDAFCAIGRDKAVRSVRPFLGDADPAVRGAAVTGMIRYGGLDGVLVAAEALKELISHPQAHLRARAAQVLGAIGVRNFYQPVLQLIGDPDPAVRRQAIAAAAVLRSPEFVIPLIYKTQSVDTMQAAVAALSAYGDAVVPTLAKVLANRLEEPSIRRAIARVLGRLGSVEAVQVITRHLEEPDEELRTRLYRSLARAVKGRRLLVPNTRPIREALERELARAYRVLHQAELLGLTAELTTRPRTARGLLDSALADKVSQTERRVFLLLAVLYPDADMEHIYSGITDASAQDAPRRRANAVELLDNLLDRRLKRLFLPLLDEMPRAARLRLVDGLVPLDPRHPPQVLEELLRDETAWVRACTVFYALQEQPPAAPAELFVSAVGDGNPVVREIGLRAVATCAPHKAATIAAGKLADESPAVRQRAALILASGQG